MGKIILFLVMCVVFISCQEELDNTTTSMQNIIGTWDVIDVIGEYREDTLFTTTDNAFEAHFLEDATGYSKTQSGFKSIYDWYYQHNPATVILLYRPSPPIIIFDPSKVFTVVTNDQDNQIWSYEETDFHDPDIYYKHTWTMTRQ